MNYENSTGRREDDIKVKTKGEEEISGVSGVRGINTTSCLRPPLPI